MPTIAIVFNRKCIATKSDLYPIHMRITFQRHSKYFLIHTPTKIAKNDWSGKTNCWVKNTHPFAFEINSKIQEEIDRVQNIIKRYYLRNMSLTEDCLLKELKKRDTIFYFNDYVRSYIKSPPEKFEFATIEKYNAFLKHLDNFKPRFHFNAINSQTIAEFKKYLEVTLNLKGSTIKSYFDKFKKIVKAAEKELLIDLSQTRFLFEDAKVKINKPTRIFLEPEEIQKLLSLSFTQNEGNLERDRDIFLFQVITGYYYNDLLGFKKNHLIFHEGYGHFILGERDKNQNDTIIPLYKFQSATKFLEKYKSDENNEFFLRSDIFIEIQAYNRNLKKLAKKAGIKKDISNKVARHTNAQLWVRQGIKRPTLSKLLGHEKEETSQHYYNINLPEVIEGTKDVDFSKFGL